MQKISKYISTLLHPILLPTLATLIFFLISPRIYPIKQIYVILTIVFLGSYIVPLLLLFLFKNLKIISHFEIPDLKERKIPVFSFIILSLLLGNILYSLPQFKLLSLLFFGSFIASIIVYFLLYLNFKTSLHLTGFSGFTTYIIILSLFYKLNLIYLIATLFLLLGVLATARLVLKAHKPSEVLVGFIIGVGSLSLITYILI